MRHSLAVMSLSENPENLQSNFVFSTFSLFYFLSADVTMPVEKQMIIWKYSAALSNIKIQQHKNGHETLF